MKFLVIILVVMSQSFFASAKEAMEPEAAIVKHSHIAIGGYVLFRLGQLGGSFGGEELPPTSICLTAASANMSFTLLDDTGLLEKIRPMLNGFEKQGYSEQLIRESIESDLKNICEI